MKTIDMNNHNFNKQNLVTTNKGDLYKCTICGCEGYRHSLAPTITVTDLMANKAMKCTFKPQNNNIGIKRPKLVLTKSVPVEGGVDEGIHEVVPCPVEYKDRYINDIWVLSNNNIPVRVLPHEIIDMEY